MTPEIRPYWKNYIGGKWVDGSKRERLAVTNPATGGQICEVARGTAQDIDDAVAAART